MRLGIDFGTTHTVVAFADRGNFPLVSFETDSGDEIDTFPSIVAAREGGELKFGLDALAVADDPSWSQARSFKRLLGRSTLGSKLSATPNGNKGSVLLAGRHVPVAELVKGLLRSLSVALKTRSTVVQSLAANEALEAVIAAPANAFCTQRFLTLDAFRKAGFHVKAMLNEPSAAGFEYTHRHARTLNSKREHVLVYDLGGGTFDASLVAMTGVEHDVVMTAGLAELGGDDFDEVLVELVGRAAGFEPSSLAAHQRRRLTDACRSAKETLGPNSRKLTIDLERSLGTDAHGPEMTLPVAAFYDACEPLVARTIDAMQPILQRMPGVDDPLSDVAGVYVVGGASALPSVARALRTRFGRRVHCSAYPHGAVAIGLAIAADEHTTFTLADRFSRHFGVFREAADGKEATYDTIFSRETALPRAGQPPLVVERRYRPQHNLGHFRFFECASVDARGNPKGDIAPLTELLMPFDPALRGKPLHEVAVERRSGPGPLISERYSVDEQGLVSVTITDHDTNFSTTHHLGSDAEEAS